MNHSNTNASPGPTRRGTPEEAQSLAQAAMEQDPQARESLLQQLYPLLASVAHKYPRVFPTRDDALQEGRVIILQSLYTYDTSRGVPFLAFVRQQLAYHFMNQARVKTEILLQDHQDETGDTWVDRIPDGSPQPDEELINDELHQWLCQALQHLKPDHRHLFEEHYGRGKPLRRIAAEPGTHPVTLSRRKAALLTLLRQQLKK